MVTKSVDSESIRSIQTVSKEHRQSLDSPCKLSSSSKACIREFCNNYKESEYSNLAQFAAELIERRLQKEAQKPFQHRLEAKVTFRAKTRKSLKEKLIMKSMDPDVNFETSQDILDKIHDLAGVRMILYMPSPDQQAKAQQILKDIWKDSLRRKERAEKTSDAQLSLTSSSSTGYQRKHEGYDAVHFIAHMRREQSTREFSAVERDKVEIQITSAMAHAWSEAEHDVSYKSVAYGKPSEQELRILDALKGQVQAADLMLEQFYEVFTNRVYRPFSEWPELAKYMKNLDIIKDIVVSSQFHERQFRVLFRFLVCFNQNCPIAILTAFREMGLPEDPTNRIAGITTEFPALASGALSTQITRELQLLIALMMYFVCKEQRVARRSRSSLSNSSHMARSWSDESSTGSDGETHRSHCLDSMQQLESSEPCTRIVFNFFLILRALLSATGASRLLEVELATVDDQKHKAAVVASINWIMTYKNWEFVIADDLSLKEEYRRPRPDRLYIPAHIRSCWQWLLEQSMMSSSFCGYIFMLVQRGFTMDVPPKACIQKLARMPQLSRM